MNGRAIRRRMLIPVLAMLNVQPVPSAAQGAPVTFREVHMGMEVRLVLVAPSDSAPIFARRAFARIAALDGVFSDWRRDSELSRLNAALPGLPVPVSRELSDVLGLALAIARDTDGAFDPTIGPLTQLWREAARTGVPISKSARAAARERVDYRWLSVDTTASRITLQRAGMRLDLGAIAKGWILDDVLAQLRQWGVPAALLEAGGDVAVFGSPDADRGWGVAVARSAGDTVLRLTEGAVSTSGPAMQMLAAPDGRGESHVMVRATGTGLRNGVQVTVTGPRAALTDALATALTILPARRGDALARRYGVRIVAREFIPSSDSTERH
jgi:thiamine biosynthesis lipoprotein